MKFIAFMSTPCAMISYLDAHSSRPSITSFQFISCNFFFSFVVLQYNLMLPFCSLFIPCSLISLIFALSMASWHRLVISLKVMLISSFLLSSCVFSIDNVISFFACCFTCFACVACCALLSLLSLDLCMCDAVFVVFIAATCAHVFALFVIIVLISFISFSILSILSSILSRICSSMTSVSTCISSKCVTMSHSFCIACCLLVFAVVPRVLITSLAIPMMAPIVDSCVMQGVLSYSGVSCISVCPELFSPSFLRGATSISSLFLGFVFIAVLVLCFTIIGSLCLIPGGVLAIMTPAMGAWVVGWLDD